MGFLLSTEAFANVSCNQVFAAAFVKSRLLLEVRFEHGIPNQVRPLISRIVHEFFNSLPDSLKRRMPPGPVAFKGSKKKKFDWGDSADPIDNSINLTTSSFRLSQASFKALVIHELTHLLVFRSFRMKNGTRLIDFLKSRQAGDEYAFLAVSSHEPLAEFLCDLMGVIITQRPNAYSQLIRELLIYWPLEFSQKYISENLDPIMGQRNFSVEIAEGEWKKFNPRFRRNHNYFNQTRAHIWKHWLVKLPPDQQFSVFEKTLELFGRLFSNPNGFDLIRWNSNDDVSFVNHVIIDLLDSELRQDQKN